MLLISLGTIDFLRTAKQKIKNLNATLIKLIKPHVNYRIGNLNIILPSDHKLPAYQRKFKMYDLKLGFIAEIIYKNYPYSIGIDIGANVGDTAAIIRSKCKMELVCIEGQPYYNNYLKQNANSIKGVTLINSFVGNNNETITGNVINKNGTASISKKGTNIIQLNSLKELLYLSNIKIENIKLLKIDTDGFDYDILLGSGELIKNQLPSIFFEYELSDDISIKKSIEVIQMLFSFGYKFIVYDNFGNFILSVKDNALKSFNELNLYLRSSKQFGGGIFYYDVFATTDDLIFDQLYDNEINLIKN